MREKTVFVYYSSHHIHETWLKSVDADLVSFIPRVFGKKSTAIYKNQVYDNFVFKNAALNQLMALLNFRSIPESDIYVLEGISTLLPVLLRRRKNSRIILINSDPFLINFEKAGFFSKRVYSWYLSHVDGVISTSEFMKQYADRYLRKPGIVVYPFVRDAFLTGRADADSRNIGAIAGTKEKRVDRIIDIFERVKERKRKLYIISPLMGDELKRKVLLLKNKDIIVTGWTDTPERYLKKCGIYINIATHESFGVNILEAMAMGIPPIVADTCGAKEIVEKVADELIVDGDDEAEIVEKIRWLEADRKRKRVLGERCRRIAKGFSQKKSVDQFRKRFAELLRAIEKDRSKQK